MDIKNFMTFKKIVEVGSFTKAAEELGYAQSTITSHIQAIEEYYDKPLFNRISKKIDITQFGSQLFEHTEQLLETYDVIRDFASWDHKPQGVLRIGVPESLMMYRLYEIIIEYKALYPGVEIVIVNDLCSHLREKTINNDIDVCFLLQPMFEYRQLNVVSLKEEQTCFIAPKDYKGTDFIPDDHHMVLFTERECTYREVFQNYLQSHNFYPQNILETGSVEAIKKYVKCGMGISFVPYYAVKEEEKNEEMKIGLWDSGITFHTQMIYHKNKWLNPAIKALLDMCQEHSQKWI